MTTTLADLRAAVRARVALSANDAQFTNSRVDRYINQAMRVVDRSTPNGWWFNNTEADYVNGTDTETYHVLLPAVDDGRNISRVSDVFGSSDGSYWQRIPRRERTDGVQLSGGAMQATSGLPYSWALHSEPNYEAGGNSQLALKFEPFLPAGSHLRLQFTVGPADFVADADPFAFFPLAFSEVVIERAAVMCLRQKRKVGANTTRRRATAYSEANTAANEWERVLRVAFATPYGRGGTVPLFERPAP